jgi:hypothetical protein
VRHLQQVVKNGDILVIYPEARYSLCGTTAALPESTGKLCKLLKVPVVTLIAHGHHVNSPFWNLKKRGVRPTEAVMTRLFTADELSGAGAGEINEKIREAFVYDDLPGRGKIASKRHTPAAPRACTRCSTMCPLQNGV